MEDQYNIQFRPDGSTPKWTAKVHKFAIKQSIG